MNGISVLKSRDSKSPIVSAFITHVLEDEVSRLEQDQTRVFNNSNDRIIDHVKNNRSYTVAGNKIIHSHAIQQRFIDMKRVGGRPQKPVKGHNQPIYNHWNSILFRLRYEMIGYLAQTLPQDIKIPV